MTTETTPVVEQQTEAPKPKDISSPGITFADYERLRRGETLETPEAKESAPARETGNGQKHASESETEDKEAKQDDDATEGSGNSEADEAEGDTDQAEAKDKPKKKGGFQRRIDKLNAAKAAAQQEAEHWKRMALEGAGATNKTAPKTESDPAAADGEPNLDTFDTYVEYVKAVSKWQAKQALTERDQKAEKTRLESEQAKRASAYTERAKAFAEKVEDFEEVLADVDDVPVSPVVSEILVASENGPEIAYELAKNRAEFERINKLAPLAAAREIGKIEARLASLASKESNAQPKTTQAPNPIAPVGGGKSSVVNKKPEDMTFTEYEKYRREQLKRRRA